MSIGRESKLLPLSPETLKIAYFCLRLLIRKGAVFIGEIRSKVAGPTRLEFATSGLTGRRSQKGIH